MIRKLYIIIFLLFYCSTIFASKLILSKELELTERKISSALVIKNYAYMACEFYGLQIVDIANPQKPEVLASLETKDACAVTVIDNYAYVADGEDGLKIISITAPSQPELIGGINIEEGNAQDVVVIGEYAYIANDNKWLTIINIKNPAKPQLVKSIEIKHGGQVTRVNKNHICMTCNQELILFDITSPETPRVAGSLEMGQIWKISIVENYAYAACLQSGFQIIDIADPMRPRLVGGVKTAFATDVVVIENYAYVADMKEGLKIFDITDPANIVCVRSLNTDLKYKIDGVIGMSGYYIYALYAHANGLKVVDTVPVILTHKMHVNVKLNAALERTYALVKIRRAQRDKIHTAYIDLLKNSMNLLSDFGFLQ